jgi:hypothetical protein
MKKIICLLAVVLMIASVAIAAKKMAITEKNLSGLKGTWEGTVGFGLTGAANSPAKLEILSDKAPVKARMTLMNVSDQVASVLGVTGGTVTFESDEGVITSQGTIMWTGPNKNWLEVILVGDKKLSGWYYYKGVKGDMNLNKK